jgi:hypothetical protein
VQKRLQRRVAVPFQLCRSGLGYKIVAIKGLEPAIKVTIGQMPAGFGPLLVAKGNELFSGVSHGTTTEHEGLGALLGNKPRFQRVPELQCCAAPLDVLAQGSCQRVAQRAGQRSDLRELKGVIAWVIIGQQMVDGGCQSIDIRAWLRVALVLFWSCIPLRPV